MQQSRLKNYAFNFLRSASQVSIVRKIFVWGLANMNDWLPIDKISETDSLICFHHPQPVYPIHILLVPKDEIHDLSQFVPGQSEFFQDLIVTVQNLVVEFNLEEHGYRLILNGGEYQDFPQLHFHLTSGAPS